MMHRLKMPEGSDAFLCPEQIKDKGLEWKKKAEFEKWSMIKSIYPMDRKEHLEEETGAKNIDEVHKISFIKDVIPEFIKEKKNGEKVKILDIGGGFGFYADQIRSEFGEKVRVYTTGLIKNVAKKKTTALGRKLHQDDFKVERRRTTKRFSRI
jgi:hypothetical protein